MVFLICETLIQAAAMISFIVFGLTFIIAYYLQSLWKLRRITPMMEELGGPPLFPFFGNALLFTGGSQGRCITLKLLFLTDGIQPKAL